MTTFARSLLAGITLLAIFAGLQSPGDSYAQGAGDLPAEIKKIAAALKKGDTDGAKKLAAATAKNVKLIEEMSDLMHMFRPVDKGGLGIEKNLKKLAVKDAQDLGNLSAAMAEIILAKGWTKDQGKKTKKAWNDYGEEMRIASAGLALAKDAAAVTAAATKVNNACTRCHNVFKD